MRFRFAALLPVLLLTACYGSQESLFTVQDGQLPLGAGTYSADDGTSWRVTIEDGHYAVPASISGTSDVVLVPLSGRSGTFIVEKGEQGGFSYSLLKLHSDGRGFELLKSDCAQPVDQVAAEGLAKRDGASCSFDSAQSVASALGRLAGADLPDRWKSYTLE